MQTYNIIISEAQRALIEQVLRENKLTVQMHVFACPTSAEADGLEMLADMFESLPDDEIIDRPMCHDFAEI